jgi:hypothetical protein
VEINPFLPNDVDARENGVLYFHPHGVPYELLQPRSGAAPETAADAAVNSIEPAAVIEAIERLLSRSKANTRH